MVIYNHKLLVHSCPTLPTKTIDIHGNVLVNRMYSLVNIVDTTECTITITTIGTIYLFHSYNVWTL